MKVFVILVLLVCRVYCSVISESNGTSSDDVTAFKLIQLGRKVHKPLLTMIGMALKNLHPCQELWSSWSSCESIVRGYVGTKKRTRKCGKINNAEDKIETDYKICEGTCLFGYNKTKNGYCLKLHLNKQNHDNAEKLCEQEGSHLVNIDTVGKALDIKQLIQGTSPYIVIGGKRNDFSSPYVYKYGSPKAAVKWTSGHPTNSTSSLCSALHPTLFKLYDKSCAFVSYFMCEYVAM